MDINVWFFHCKENKFSRYASLKMRKFKIANVQSGRLISKSTRVFAQVNENHVREGKPSVSHLPVVKLQMDLYANFYAPPSAKEIRFVLHAPQREKFAREIPIFTRIVQTLQIYARFLKPLVNSRKFQSTKIKVKRKQRDRERERESTLRAVWSTVPFPNVGCFQPQRLDSSKGNRVCNIFSSASVDGHTRYK